MPGLRHSRSSFLLNGLDADQGGGMRHLSLQPQLEKEAAESTKVLDF